MSDALDFFARAALGIGIGATLAAGLSQTAFAGTVGLGDAEQTAVNVALIAALVWLVCRFVSLRRGH